MYIQQNVVGTIKGSLGMIREGSHVWSGHSEHLQNMFLWRTDADYLSIIIK